MLWTELFDRCINGYTWLSKGKVREKDTNFVCYIWCIQLLLQYVVYAFVFLFYIVDIIVSIDIQQIYTIFVISCHIIYIYIYIYIYICMYICICIYIHTYIYIYIYVYVFMFPCIIIFIALMLSWALFRWVYMGVPKCSSCHKDTTAMTVRGCFIKITQIIHTYIHIYIHTYIHTIHYHTRDCILVGNFFNIQQMIIFCAKSDVLMFMLLCILKGYCVYAYNCTSFNALPSIS